MKLLYAATLLLAALLSVADDSVTVLTTVPGGRSFSDEEPDDVSVPILTTVPGGRSFSDEEPNDGGVPVSTTVPEERSFPYKKPNDGGVPVLTTVPEGRTFSYKEPNDGRVTILTTVPDGRSFPYKEPKHGSVPVPAKVRAGPDFSYEGPDGPDHWGEMYETCAGKFQSPIDIEEHLVTTVRLPPLAFHGFNRLPISSTLTNNGHTVMLQMNLTSPALLSGGPLSGDYVFHQLHFHWGNNDSVGSESTINNLTFPLEMHMVTYKQEYGDFDSALDHEDGLAVLAVFFEIYGDGNPYYSEITELLPQVTGANSQAHLQYAVTLLSLLPETKHLYFTYHGSLTTPPCLEVVTWIEFKQPILLNHNQVKAFRTMNSTKGELTFNFRPIQPLSNRIVRFNVADNMRQVTASHNSAFSPFVTSFMLGIFLVLMLVVLHQ